MFVYVAERAREGEEERGRKKGLAMDGREDAEAEASGSKLH